MKRSRALKLVSIIPSTKRLRSLRHEIVLARASHQVFRGVSCSNYFTVIHPWGGTYVLFPSHVVHCALDATTSVVNRRRSFRFVSLQRNLMSNCNSCWSGFSEFSKVYSINQFLHDSFNPSQHYSLIKAPNTYIIPLFIRILNTIPSFQHMNCYIEFK